MTIVAFTIGAALPRAASSQLSHADSAVARTIADIVQSIDGGQIIVTGDSTLHSLLEAVPKSVGICLPMFYVERLIVSVRGDKDAPAHLDISMQGSVLKPGISVSHPYSFSRTVDVSL